MQENLIFTFRPCYTPDMKQIKTLKDLVDFWPSRDAFAAAISEADDVIPSSRVWQWQKRNAVPLEYRARVQQAAIRRKHSLNVPDHITEKGSQNG